MKQILNTEKFKLELVIEYYKEAEYEDCVLNLKVESEGFAASTSFEVYRKSFFYFVKNLKNMYDSLDGNAKIEDAYEGRGYIEFASDSTGHINIKGLLISPLHNQELKFENEFDQTYLRDFVSDLCSTYQEYL